MTPAQLAASSVVDMLRMACAFVVAFILMELMTAEPDDPDGMA